MRRAPILLAAASALALAACVSGGGGFQVDGIYRDEISIGAIMSAMLADETARQIQTGEVRPAGVPAAVEANEALADVLSRCRGKAVSGRGGSATCILGVANTALQLEGFLTDDPESDQVDLVEALALFGDALLSADPRMIVLWLEIDGLQEGELLDLDVVAGAFTEMDASLRALDDVAIEVVQ